MIGTFSIALDHLKATEEFYLQNCVALYTLIFILRYQSSCTNHQAMENGTCSYLE